MGIMHDETQHYARPEDQSFYAIQRSDSGEPRIIEPNVNVSDIEAFSPTKPQLCSTMYNVPNDAAQHTVLIDTIEIDGIVSLMALTGVTIGGTAIQEAEGRLEIRDEAGNAVAAIKVAFHALNVHDSVAVSPQFPVKSGSTVYFIAECGFSGGGYLQLFGYVTVTPN